MRADETAQPDVQPDRVGLDTFLHELDDTVAAEARVAAARIDDLAREGVAVEGIERRFLPYAALALVAFVAGIITFLRPDLVPRLVTLALLAALPGIAVVYGIRVMGRTRADRAAEELNIRHFLPHGGIYFAAGENPACVVRVPKQTEVQRGPRISRKDIWS